MKKNKLSFFYNHCSKDFIHASCEHYQFGDWGIKNAAIFCLDSNHEIHKLNFKTDSKIFKSAIYTEGWSYAYIHDKYCVIGALNLETGKEVLNIVAKENNVESAYLELGDLNTVFLEKDDMQVFLNTGEFKNHLFNNHLEKNLELNELIKELRLLDCSEQTFVFGSIIKGKIAPPDLDIWVDATDITLNPETQNKIVELVEKYSLRLDPYIRKKDTILAVDSNIFTSEFKWIDLAATEEYHIVENFNIWKKNAKAGVPINDLELLPTKMEELLKKTVIEKKLKIKM